MQLDRYIDVTITNGTDSYSVSGGNFSVSSGSMSISEVVCEGELQFGTLSSDKLEFELYYLTDTHPDFSGMNISVAIKSNNLATTNTIFTGKVDSSTTTKGDYSRKIVAYDKANTYRNVDVCSYYNAYFATSGAKTLGGLRNYICVQLGIGYFTRTLVNENLYIAQGSYTSMSFETLMNSICQLQACFPHFNREGVLDFITLSTTSKSVLNYESDNSTFEDYTTHNITGISVYSSSNELSQQYPSAGVGVNPIVISGNLILLDLPSDSITTACNTLLNAINSVTYIPCELKMIISDYGIATEDYCRDLQLGNKITTETGTHYILEQEYSGSLLVEQTIRCGGDEYMSGDVSTVNDTIAEGKKFSSIEQNVDSITSSVGDLSNSVTTLTQTSSTISGKVSVLENTVEDATDEDGKLVASSVVVTEKGFTFDKDGLTISETGSDISTNIDEDGLQVLSGGTPILTAKSDSSGSAVVQAYRLKATGYLSVGNYSRFMDYEPSSGVHRTGVFWIDEE